jgi:hypothetical protein
MMKTQSLSLETGLLIFTAVLGILLLCFPSVYAEVSPGELNVEKIPIGSISPLHSPPMPSTKGSCLLQHDDGVALTYFPNWNPGD